MPFFTPAHYTPEADIFSILSALSEDSTPQKSCARRQAPDQTQTFSPRFDVIETDNAYELHGELAGLAEKDLSIEFFDAQTIVIKGKTDRFTSATKAPELEAMPALQDDNHSEAGSEKSHQPTVEDEYDTSDAPLATTVSNVTAQNEPDEKPAEKKEEEKKKFWVSERRVGSFTRRFSFSHRIEIDEVSASLKNGLLRVVVPKSQKAKKIAVQIQ
ncbi:putative 30 kDa heat shock protein [Calycina marina]|uniref:30 kDa heat shock protein n=1 Tax=Calycina marina TaxID=1763456 RepID=A0A9P8CC95_9HELO|nr:putative 30 kDa heat shock protein [Calycina marina]